MSDFLRDMGVTSLTETAVAVWFADADAVEANDSAVAAAAAATAATRGSRFHNLRACFVAFFCFDDRVGEGRHNAQQYGERGPWLLERDQV